MKITYEINDDDEINKKIYKYAEDMYLSLVRIDQIIVEEYKGFTNVHKDRLIQLIENELIKSNIRDIE